MKRLRDALAKDLWVALLDVIAVNASYYLALLIRFYVNFQLRPVAVREYLPAWAAFTPWYTVLCLVVFLLFRLYGGMWRYAGVNDMNRILGASLATTVIHVVGTAAFVWRMPVTYYVIGSLLQFMMITAIRFGYRVLLVEKKRLERRRGVRIPTAVIGSGENGRRVVKTLEESDVYRPVAVLGAGGGNMDGIPVLPLDRLSDLQVSAVFIADPLLTNEDRERIRKTGLEIHEYTGFFTNLGGRLSLTELLATIHTSLTIEVEGAERRFSSGEEALRELTEKYSVHEISGDGIVIRLEKNQPQTAQEALEQAYAAVLGEET